MIKKKFGIGMLILATLLVSTALVPVVSAAADQSYANNSSDEKIETYGIEGLTPEKVKEIEDRAQYLSNLPDTIHNAPYWPMVATDDETKKAILGYIDNLSISKTEKKEMKKELKDIWSRVPDKITEEDYPVIQKIGDAVTRYVEETYWKDEQSTKWMTNVHGSLISSGVYLAYGNSNWANWAYSTAMEPDTSIDTGTITVILDIVPPIWISIPESCYYHYYNPDIYFGGAPGKCASYAAQAKTYYGSQDYENAFETLGIASHYLSDVSQPMHSGGESGSLADYLLNWNGNLYHYRYEQYVEDNWNTGRNFSRWVSENTDTYSVTDPAAAVRSMAAYSNPYSSLLWNEIYANPNFDQGDDTTEIQYITIIMNREAAKYNAGLAEYISS